MKNAPSPDDEKYDKWRDVYVSCYREANIRARLRLLKSQSATAKYWSEKLANTVKTMELLKKAVDNPRICKKLNYIINPCFFKENNDHTKNQPCLCLESTAEHMILSKPLLRPSKMMKNVQLKFLHKN